MEDSAVGDDQGAVGTFRKHVAQKTAQNACISWLFLSLYIFKSSGPLE